jgi:DNA primase
MSGFRGSVPRIDVLEQTLKVKDERRLGWIPKPIMWPSGFVWLSPFGRQAGNAHQRAVKYALSRGWSDREAVTMNLGVCEHGRFRNRIIFPVLDSGGRLIFFQGRATWTPKDPNAKHVKTLSPRHVSDEEAGPADCLLNLETVEREGFDHVLVVEGPTDGIKALPDAVGTFGKKISPRQMELLIRSGVKKLDLCWDNDTIEPEKRERGVISGYEAALKIAPVLADMFEVRVVCLPPDVDPGVLTKPQIEMYRADARKWGHGDRLARIPDVL